VSTTKLTFRQRAEPGTRFAPDAFESQLGKEIPLLINSHQNGVAHLLAAKVSEDGTEVELTIEVDTTFAWAQSIRLRLRQE
jgi:hypothetical protein